MNIVNTEGGAHVGGNLTVGSGDFCGRDKIVNGAKNKAGSDPILINNGSYKTLDQMIETLVRYRAELAFRYGERTAAKAQAAVYSEDDSEYHGIHSDWTPDVVDTSRINLLNDNIDTGRMVVNIAEGRD